MKILYLSDTDLDTTSGVAKKILMQVNKWADEGHEVEILSWDSMSWFSLNGNRLTSPKIFIKRRKWKVFFHLLESTFFLLKGLKNKKYDIIYMRYRLYFPFFLKIKKYGKLIVEINTNDKEEFKRSIMLYIYNRVLREFFLNKVDGFVCVSNELENIFKIYNKPICVIANGIDVSKYEFYENTSSNKPNLVFIGSPGQKWHGLEKIEYLSQKLPEFNFHIVGISGESRNNIYYYGYVNDKKAREIVSKMDVGISTLSLYKNKMEEASPLKSRQYLAHGLPIIYAYIDTDIKKECEFCCQLPNCRDNIKNNIEKIKKFVLKVFKNKEIRFEAREFAKNVLDVNKKEKKRLSFFKKVIDEK